jgi:hypothetical protein
VTFDDGPSARSGPIVTSQGDDHLLKDAGKLDLPYLGHEQSAALEG